MLTTADFAKGVRILIGNDPCEIIETTSQSPSARGSATLVKVKARSLLTGKLLNETFKAGTKFEEPEVHFATVQYLYTEGSDIVVMDKENYEQFSLPSENIGSRVKYLHEDLDLRALYYNGSIVNLELPAQVKLEVEFSEPGEKGNTASSTVTKLARMTNGIEVQVPLFIKEGQSIWVNTIDDSFAKKG